MVANSGICFAAAEALACASGTFHVVMASRSLEKTQAVMSELEAARPLKKLSPPCSWMSLLSQWVQRRMIESMMIYVSGIQGYKTQWE